VSDYLRGLATRVLAPRQVLQPRVPMRYEPVAIEEESIVEPGGRGARRSTKALVERQAPPPVDAAPAAIIHPVGNPVGGQAPSPVTRSLSHRQSRTGEAPVPPLDSSLAVSPDSQPDLSLQSPLGQPMEPRPDPPLEPITRQRNTHTHTHSHTTSVTQPQPPPPPRVIERHHLRREASVIERTIAPAPIEITIGRIDVRAVVAPQPAAKPRPQPRVMSLDEYAAKREGKK